MYVCMCEEGIQVDRNQVCVTYCFVKKTQNNTKRARRRATGPAPHTYFLQATQVVYKRTLVHYSSPQRKSMGNLFAKLWNKFFNYAEFKVVIVGLDNAGKTTTLYKL